MELNYKLILASNSPRRKELLSGLDINYEVVVIPGIDESYPDTIEKRQVAQYIAQKKAAAYGDYLKENTLVITADTVVILDNKIFGKPANEVAAKQMLRELSGHTHQVITGVCLTSAEKQHSFSVISEVRFCTLSESEIDYYVTRYQPMDKAGAYGIQEWIGYVGVEFISGSYYNVMGLPIQRLYRELKNF
ncbi:Maf-like protein [Dysgonomonas macrotermitis]|uniref:dTTP/UTP pyrophosphatase n=1 Tax=Dysgonomonas macrotermitis TaxID=1346286 RepID=A0A1M5AS94_9BACT|nr:Maf-like protein [Dysgonomonas macrotermitis]SHF33103.1 septum formation protein [Dysgonomonas macrotermitis]